MEGGKGSSYGEKVATSECLCVELEDKSGDKKLYRIAKMRERRNRDLNQVKCIKMKMEKY